MKLAIIGGRDFTDKQLFNKVLNKLLKKDMFSDITKIVSGGAKGADSLGEEYADEHEIEKEIFLPDWNKHGRSAGYIRNHKIMVNSDIAIAFWDGKSKGTAHSIDLARGFKETLVIVKYKLFILSKNKKKFKIEKIYLSDK